MYEVRDQWEAQLASLSSRVTVLLGQIYTFEIDLAALYPHAIGWAKRNPGAITTRRYFEDFTTSLEHYVRRYGCQWPFDGCKGNVRATVEKEFPSLQKRFSEILGMNIKLDSNLSRKSV